MPTSVALIARSIQFWVNAHHQPIAWQYPRAHRSGSCHDRSMNRRYRAGESVEDFCRACKTDRHHTIIVVDADSRPLRVSCDYCDSQHNFRGGPRIHVSPERERSSTSSGEPDKTRPTSPGGSDYSRLTRPGGPDNARPASPDRPDNGPPTSTITPTTRPSSPVPGEEGIAFRVPTESASGDLETLLRRILREESG